MLYTAPFLVSALLALLFSYFFIVRSRKVEPNIILILLSVSVFFWQSSWFFLQYFPGYGDFIAKFGHMWILFIPVLLFHFGLAAMGKIDKRFLILAYSLVGIMQAVLVSTDYIIDGTHEVFWGIYPKAGDFHFLFILFVSVMVLKILWLIFKEYRTTAVIEKKKQYMYLLIGIGFFSLASVDFIANYISGMYPFGFVFIWLFLGCILYAVSKYNLISTNALLDKFFVVFVLSAITYVFWLLLFFAEQMYVGPLLGETVLLLNFIVMPAFIFGLIEIFKKVSIFSRDFFHTFRGKEILHNMLVEISRLGDDVSLPQYVSEKLSAVFAAECYVVYKKEGDVIVAGDNLSAEKAIVADKENVWRVADNRNTFTILNEQKMKCIMPDSHRNDFIHILEQQGIEIVMPFGENAYVLLGEKDSEKIYSAEEIKFLKRLAEKFATTHM